MTGQSAAGTADRNAVIVLRFTGLCLVVGASLAPLATAAAATVDGSASIADLRISRWLFAVLLTIIVIATVVELNPRHRGAAQMVVFAIGTVIALTPLFLVAALETLTAVLSPDVLPPALQDLPPRGEPLIGVWLLAAGSGLIMLSASGSAGSAMEHLGDLLRGIAARRAESIAVVLGALGVALFVLGRYESWMRIDSNVTDWNVVAQSAPVLGLASLVLLSLCSVCVLGAAIRPSVPLGVATLTLGWVSTLVPATMVVIGRAMPAVTAPEWLRSRLADWSAQGTELASGLPDAVPLDAPELPATLEVELLVGRGATMLFLAGLLVGLSGLFVIRAACSEVRR